MAHRKRYRLSVGGIVSKKNRFQKKVSEVKFELGECVRCMKTGLQATIIGKAQYLYSHNQYLIQYLKIDLPEQTFEKSEWVEGLQLQNLN